MLSLLALATWLFVVTHVDTLVVLVAFCVDETYSPAEVGIGHYLGFLAGLSAAVVAAVVAAEFFREWAALFGVVPIALGVWGLFRRRPDTGSVVVDGVSDRPGRISQSERTGAVGSVSERTGRVGVVAGAGVGLSGENVALFVPFFLSLSSAELANVVLLYVVFAGVLLLLALGVARRVPDASLPPWIDRWLVPTVLILVGMYVVLAGIAAG